VWAAFVEICLQRGHTEDLVGVGWSYPVRAAGSGRDERRELAFVAVCCVRFWSETGAVEHLGSLGLHTQSVLDANVAIKQN
jgi:hypothetical protein